MAHNPIVKGTAPPWVESWSAVAIVGILFVVIGVVGVVAIFKLTGASEAVAVITALTTAGGTIVGILAGANIGGAGRASAEQRAETATKESAEQRGTAVDNLKRAEIAEAEAKRDRDEVEVQRSAALDGQQVLEQAFDAFATLQDKLHNWQQKKGVTLRITPNQLGAIDKKLSDTRQALAAITGKRVETGKGKQAHAS